MTFLDSITTPDMVARLDAMAAEQPAIATTLYMLGTDRRAEWLHSIGVASDPTLRSLAPPIPPPSLREIVAATEEEVFLWTGIIDLCQFVDLYERHVIGRPERPCVLDFGCGCGRLTRLLDASTRYKTLACDLNPEHVAWCTENLKNVTTTVNAPAPPLPFADSSVDFAYLLSVFTHLPERAILAWLIELSRVLRPGGIVIATTHGASVLETIGRSKLHQGMFGIDAAGARALSLSLEKEGHIFLPYGETDTNRRRANVGTETEYGNSFTSPDRARDKWGAYFDILTYMPAGQRGWQDIYVLRSLT